MGFTGQVGFTPHVLRAHFCITAIGNWHSIFRNGLKNYSGTDKMSAGAAYGSGIYLASDANTSFGYMSAGAGWDKTLMGKSSSVACIALCEG